MPYRSNQVSRLADLLGELDELEKSRLALLARVESLREKLLAAGDRTTTMRASVDLLSDHIDDLSDSKAEASAFELELPEIQKSIEEAIAEASGLAFESESLNETLNETDRDLERLTSIFVERRGRRSRGH